MIKKKMLKRLVLWSACAGGLILLQRFCHQQTDGFSRYKISSNLTFQPEWETPRLSLREQESLSKILNQPYRYLAKGAQSYVFLSDDGKYVLKFFRIYHLQPPFWVTHLRWPWFLQSYKMDKILKKLDELHKDFASYKIAHDELKEETGIVYLHLNKTDYLKQTLTFYDKIGIKHQVALDQMEFLVQKRAELVYPALAKMVESEGLENAKDALSQLVSLLCLRCQKGIHDKDPDLNTNFGFIGHTPLQIDVGRFRIENGNLQEQMVDRDEIIRITDNLNQWLRSRYPELSGHLETTIAQIPHSHDQ
ncbi:MAG: hypothetical protein KF898_07985 [Parachlamydiales bacterium]|nr:hypothetical protein [Verrucomicrobiota bacterium]MBX3719571.1 hypothetical protein [Candidatus Acheromyda pituitae]